MLQAVFLELAEGSIYLLAIIRYRKLIILVRRKWIRLRQWCLVRRTLSVHVELERKVKDIITVKVISKVIFVCPSPPSPISLFPHRPLSPTNTSSPIPTPQVHHHKHRHPITALRLEVTAISFILLYISLTEVTSGDLCLAAKLFFLISQTSSRNTGR